MKVTRIEKSGKDEIIIEVNGVTLNCFVTTEEFDDGVSYDTLELRSIAPLNNFLINADQKHMPMTAQRLVNEAQIQ